MPILIALLWAVVLTGCWFFYHLLIEHGRLRLQVESLEKELRARDILPDPAKALPSGLPPGSTLSDFELTALNGRKMTLSQWRGRRVLLIFFNPKCSYCVAMLPGLATLPAPDDRADPAPLIVTTGDPEENRRMFEEHRILVPALLQEGAELATLYRVSGTPMGYLVDQNGETASELIIGAEKLLSIAREPHSSAEGQFSAERRSSRPAFSRSLAESKLLRNGLKAGVAAPDFTLPRLDKGELSLQHFKGRRVLLVFSDPGCEPCDQVSRELEKIYREKHDFQILMISRGSRDANRAKAAEHCLTFPIVLQQHWQVSRMYGIFGTPVGYWVDEEGKIAAEVAVGKDPILKSIPRKRAQRRFE